MMKAEGYKIAVIELDKRKAISWGLATRLKFDPTLEYIIGLIEEIKILKALNTHLKTALEAGRAMAKATSNNRAVSETGD